MKGINFKPEMIQAIAEGRKTVTRRVMKPQPQLTIPDAVYKENLCKFTSLKTRYQVGETVYIKEAIHRFNVEYASYDLDFTPVMFLLSANRFHWRWEKDKLSPMFLPHEAARYFIQITDVRAERLWEITVGDTKREGITEKPIERFKFLWDSTNPKYPLESDPWCWRYEFKLVKGVALNTD